MSAASIRKKSFLCFHICLFYFSSSSLRLVEADSSRWECGVYCGVYYASLHTTKMEANFMTNIKTRITFMGKLPHFIIGESKAPRHRHLAYGSPRWS